MMAWAATGELFSRPRELALDELDSLPKVQSCTCVVVQPLYESGPEHFCQPGFLIRLKQY
jgi:hypothetical protein